jgi:hypothetical protein
MAAVRLFTFALIAVAICSCARRPATVGFWFEDVSFESAALGGALTAADMRVIEAVAREELAIAFRDLDVLLTDSREARYRVRVVQELFGNPMVRKFAVAGESRSLPLVGAFGAVNFSYFANGATVFAPAGISRPELVAAIGRGLGRGAVHEFAHQMVRGINVHAIRDRGSYEYYAASRAQQYFGPMHWDPGTKVRLRFDVGTKPGLTAEVEPP